MKDSTLKLPSPKRKEFLEQATSEYAESVSLAQTYLEARGIPADIAAEWRLGVVLDPLPGHERFKNYLSIPYLTRAGTVAMKFRCIRCEAGCKGHGKYDGEKGQGLFLFGALSFWADSRFICVTEGELDVISCAVAGLPAVGIPGGNNWRQHWSYCFEGYEEVIALQDGFKEGDQARDKFAFHVGHNIDNSSVREFAAGEDVNSYLVKYGPDALRRFVRGAD